MPTDIKLKNSVTATNAPTSLQQGEVAINITDKKVWVGNAATTPVLLLGSGADGTFTNLTVSGVATFGAGTVSLPSITTTGDTNTGIFFPAADTIAFTEGGVESMRITSTGAIRVGSSATPSASSAILSLVGAPSGGASCSQQFTYNGGTYGGSLLAVSAQGGGLEFYTFTGNVGSESYSERMRIDSSGNVGIGETNPNEAMVIKRGAGVAAVTAYRGNGTTSTGEFFVGHGSDAIAYVFNRSNQPLVFATNNTERMRIDSSGNVGIGMTTSGDSRLEIYSADSATVYKNVNTGTGTSDGFYVGMGKSSSTDAYVYNRENAPVIFGTNNAERMRIDNAGLVGIGTSSPSSYNASADNLVVAGSADSGITVASGTTSTGYLIFADGTSGSDAFTGYIGYNHGSNYMQFHTNGGTERMRIDSSGNVKINSTSSGDGAKFVVANSGSTGCSFQQGDATFATAEVVNSGSTGTRFLFSFRSSSGGSNLGTITHNGSNVAYNTSSDYRLKENIAPMTGALATVSALKPVTYNWKLDGSSGQGFIAHELQSVVPDCVVGEKDAVNEDGSIKAQGIDTSFLVATLTAAIQELKAEFDAYKATHP